ncbi:hypothetical protein QAD02_012941 [Eretmocerus hayati]|uniref:Uncharacterized protein n=1 Tax=Eretmocerus hayati TaxID=131215 RepID=A0ACC2P0U1_9HYME|nr:hypothetical protein QAD02_012941 [Eretmocerus hayati]
MIKNYNLSKCVVRPHTKIVTGNGHPSVAENTGLPCHAPGITSYLNKPRCSCFNSGPVYTHEITSCRPQGPPGSASFNEELRHPSSDPVDEAAELVNPSTICGESSAKSEHIMAENEQNIFHDSIHLNMQRSPSTGGEGFPNGPSFVSKEENLDSDGGLCVGKNLHQLVLRTSLTT